MSEEKGLGEQYDAAFMSAAFAEAEQAKQEDEVPIGCVFVKDGKVVAGGRNATNARFDGCAHAELVAARALQAKVGNAAAAALLEGSHLYVTVEPCVMCAAAVLLLKVACVFYGCGNQRFGGCSGVLRIHEENPFYKLPCFGGHEADRAIRLLRGFYETENTNCPESKRRRKIQQ
eukprot:Rhum_TRINITY_DN173_c0_g1::Rhum_TRINITY_DN173_c0_g1_i1::g.507::m.507/K15441/TAD2, ADAT2; tRNA-specific adenosine deaminase 2